MTASSPRETADDASRFGLTDSLLDELRLREEADWPAAEFAQLAEAGILRWSVPEEFEGLAVDDRLFTAGYIALAEADLATCFVLTQRNGAVQRIASSRNATVHRWLPRLASGELFATVGISHLTTSRQHTAPPVRVTEKGDAFVLSGTVPWATSATRADLLVTGGQLEDGRQLLAVVDVGAAGDRVRPNSPMTLLALSASETGTVTLDDVVVSRDDVIAGPVEAVMKQGSGGGAGSLTTSALAVGLSERAVRGLERESAGRDEVGGPAASLRDAVDRLRSDVLETAAGGTSHSAESLRSRANSLASRATQAYLTATKGAGFVAGHPAEQAVREAMFFLVWSCPRPVAEAALQGFACSA